MSSANYARFLPPTYRDRADTVAPTSTWWEWRGRRVHIARAHNPAAPVRLLGIHGAGGHARALWPLTALAGGDPVDVLVPDLPPYGNTVDPHPGRVRYETWIDLLCDLVAIEKRADDRPLVLLGGSMGGMMAYEVAAQTTHAAAVVATCLLDPSDPAARRSAARFSSTGRIAPTLLNALDRIAGRTLIPIRWLADMNKMSNNSELNRQVIADRQGGGNRVPIGLLASFLNYQHTRPETFDAAPVLLVHPAADRWTPPEHSIRFLNRIKAPTTLKLLEGCGHYPIEEPGLTQLAETLRALRNDLLNPA